MADFKTYDHIVKWIAKGQLGVRRKRSFSFRMAHEGSDVVVMSNSRRVWVKKPDGNWDYNNAEWRHFDFAEIRPGDVLTFTRDSAEMREIAVSMSSTFWKVLGLCWMRVGAGRYSLFHYDDNGKALYWQARRGNSEKFEFFKGMQWEFARGICINPRKPMLKQVDRDKRKDWVADLKRFKRAFLTRAKLGVVDQIIAEYSQTGVSDTSKWNVPIDDAVLETIQSGEVTTGFIIQVVACRANTGWRPNLTRTSVCNMLNQIISRNSIRYRQEYGVLQK